MGTERRVGPDEWVEEFFARFPAFSDLRDDPFYRDDDGRILIHLILGAVTPRLDSKEVSSRETREILDYLEASYGRADDALENALAVSFVENLGPDSPLLYRLGPELTRVASGLFPSSFTWNGYVTARRRARRRDRIRRATKRLRTDQTERFTCLACGYPGLYEDPSNWMSTYEICPCCDFQYGVTDDDEGWTTAEWREDWIRRGMPWRYPGHGYSSSWDPEEQLRAAFGDV